MLHYYNEKTDQTTSRTELYIGPHIIVYIFLSTTSKYSAISNSIVCSKNVSICSIVEYVIKIFRSGYVVYVTDYCCHLIIHHASGLMQLIVLYKQNVDDSLK